MAQWSHADRTLHAKVVYYGPAFGGKTTNLEALHRITDPKKANKLLSVKTANDRTLFFDLLPLDLGDILGYQVAMKLYTVPGQVRYDTTRQVVLAGADALVFVADSSASRKEQNVWSLQNLQMNMRAKGLDPSRVPVLYQFNKQDLPDSAPPQMVASWLGIPAEKGFAAVAIDGKGVLETFMSASRAMLEKLVAMADGRTRREIDSGELGGQLDRAFAPYVARLEESETETPGPDLTSQTPIILDDENLLEGAVQTGVRLGEELTTEATRASRLEREAETFRKISELLRGVGASFDRERIVGATLRAVKETLEVPVVSLVRDGDGPDEALTLGSDEEPLLDFAEGRELLDRMRSAAGPCVVEELADECPMPDNAILLNSLRAVAAVPVEATGRLSLVAYAPRPDGAFRQPDVRFMVTVAGHLAVGLEKARLHADLSGHRDHLEQTVAERTEQLREAYDDLRRLDEMKDRFLANLSHEMKSPLTAVLSAATVIRDYESDPVERMELVGSIVTSAEMLQRQLEDLFRLVNLEQSDEPLELDDVKPERLAEEAIQISGGSGIQYKIEELPDLVRVDLDTLGRAVANLIDNAVKFSPTSSLVKLHLHGDCVEEEGTVDTLVLSVLDRGPGVPEEDRKRIFAPFEQGGDTLTSKPRGIGIGLHEARTTVERHGGSLDYFPRKGGGSEFRMTIPLHSHPEEAVVEESLA